MIVVEGNSLKHPCSSKELNGHKVITSKVPTPNTEYLCARHIDLRSGEYPFMCYKWLESRDHPEIRIDDVWQADFKRWDDYFLEFNPKFPDPSSGTCAVFCVIERWKPKQIGLIGFDWVLDGNSEWIHDSKAELKAICSLTEVIDLRDNTICRV